VTTFSPPIIEKARMWTICAPGGGGVLAARTFRPPMNENPVTSTTTSSGTKMLIPPMNARALIVTSGPSNSASRRSR